MIQQSRARRALVLFSERRSSPSRVLVSWFALASFFAYSNFGIADLLLACPHLSDSGQHQQYGIILCDRLHLLVNRFQFIGGRSTRRQNRSTSLTQREFPEPLGGSPQNCNLVNLHFRICKSRLLNQAR